MGDICDQSDDRIQREVDNSLAAARRASSLAYVGECYNCGESTPQGVNFCDVDCRETYEMIVRMKRIRGEK